MCLNSHQERRLGISDKPSSLHGTLHDAQTISQTEIPSAEAGTTSTEGQHIEYECGIFTVPEHTSMDEHACHCCPPLRAS